MVAGQWLNQDGLNLQFGTQKAIPEIGGDYLIYGETREIETLVPLVPYQLTAAGQPVPAPAQTTFSGTTTTAAAGIQSLTTMLPLQITAPVITTTSGTLLLSNPQLFIEQVDTEGLVSAAGGTSVAVGLAFGQAGSPSGTFVQVTPNAGTQILKNVVTATLAAGTRATWTSPGATGFLWNNTASATVAGGGDWVGVNMPLVTNAITPLPTTAWLSVVNTGTFTNGLFKLRIRYTCYGNIPF